MVSYTEAIGALSPKTANLCTKKAFSVGARTVLRALSTEIPVQLVLLSVHAGAPV
jgi:hypothetical protein